jgi:hypothetical protein
LSSVFIEKDRLGGDILKINLQLLARIAKVTGKENVRGLNQPVEDPTPLVIRKIEGDGSFSPAVMLKEKARPTGTR